MLQERCKVIEDKVQHAKVKDGTIRLNILSGVFRRSAQGVFIRSFTLEQEPLPDYLPASSNPSAVNSG